MRTEFFKWKPNGKVLQGGNVDFYLFSPLALTNAWTFISEKLLEEIFCAAYLNSFARRPSRYCSDFFPSKGEFPRRHNKSCNPMKNRRHFGEELLWHKWSSKVWCARGTWVEVIDGFKLRWFAWCDGITIDFPCESKLFRVLKYSRTTGAAIEQKRQCHWLRWTFWFCRRTTRTQNMQDPRWPQLRRQSLRDARRKSTLGQSK